MPEEVLTLEPIGFIQTNFRSKFSAPSQPWVERGECNCIELNPGCNFEQALRDLATFDRIWLVWWFHRNKNWKPMVLPPRGEAKRRGVFATRSPHRPNPIGLTSVPLLGIEGRKIFVGSCDLVDGTPILDIKPYLANVDAFPESSLGWLVPIEAERLGPPAFSVVLGELAQQQLNWLKDTWQIDFWSAASELLQRDPSPHRTRRIVGGKDKDGSRTSRLSCGSWRVYFLIDQAEKRVQVERITPGYPAKLLAQDHETIVDREAQQAFLKLWPDGQK